MVARRLRLQLSAVVVAAWAAACSPLPPQRIAQPADPTIYVIGRGWHTDLGVSARDLDGPLAVFEHSFPGVRYLAFGFGDRGYVLSRRTTFADMLLAMLPGQGAMLVTALRASPAEAFGDADAIALRLSPAGLERVAAFLWDYFDKDQRGEPRRLAGGPYPGSAFYASDGTYDAFHTCNTWVAEALRAGGLPVDAVGIVLAGQVMDRARRLALLQAGDGSLAQAGTE